MTLIEEIGALLKARRETIAVSESSTGGLISAALLSIESASAYYRGGAIVYTPKARAALMGLSREEMGDMRSASEACEICRRRRAKDRSEPSLSRARPTGKGIGGIDLSIPMRCVLAIMHSHWSY